MLDFPGKSCQQCVKLLVRVNVFLWRELWTSNSCNELGRNYTSVGIMNMIKLMTRVWYKVCINTNLAQPGG